MILFSSWNMLKNMLPGSELEQIKEINDKLVKTSTVLSLSVTSCAAQNFTKRSREASGLSYTATSSKKKKEQKYLAVTDTLIIPDNEILAMTTLPESELKIEIPEIKAKLAFSLNFVGEEKFLELAKKCDLDKIDIFWKPQSSCQHVLERNNFMSFPKDILTRISIQFLYYY